MICFLMINPSLKYPFLTEIKSRGNISTHDQVKSFVSSLLHRKKYPLADEKYVVQHPTIWRGLEEVHKGYTNFDWSSRLSLKDAAEIMSRENGRVSTDLDVMHLKVSQSKAVKQFNCSLAVQLKDNDTADQ